MTTELLGTIKKDTKRCEEAQSSNKSSYKLYQTDYKSELNVIKEKLEVAMMEDIEKDPLFDFKAMYEEDLKLLKEAISDSSNRETFEITKQQLYKEVTAKYDAYVPKFSDGLYGYEENCKFYDELSGTELFHDLRQIYNKMLSFKALGYPSLKECISQNVPMVQITNTNENKVDINVSFDTVRREIENMSALPDAEIREILSRIDELEEIVKSSERRSKKWENAKEIIKWIADKGVDVGIALLPLLLQIK